MKKTLASAVVVVIVAAAGIGFWFYSSFDAVVKAAIEEYLPPITQTSVSVGRIKLSPTDGAGQINDFILGNPKGFRTPHAFAAKTIELAIDPASLAGDVVVIRRIVIAAPSISYEISDAGSNFDVIGRNVDRYLGSDKKKERKPEKKMIVELLSIRAATVGYAPAMLKGKSIDMTLPNLTLKNIGKDRGGLTGPQLAEAITDALKSSITNSIAAAAKSVGNAAAQAAKGAAQAAKGMGDKLRGLLGK